MPQIGPETTQITIFDSFDAAKSVWMEFEHEADCYAFQSFNWLSNWHLKLGSEPQVQVFIVYVEYPAGRPLMLLPLGIQKRGIASCLVWLGGVISDYLGPLISKDYSRTFNASRFEILWKDIQSELPHFDAVLLEKQPESIAGQHNPFLFLHCEPHTCSAHSTSLTGPLDSFLKTKRSSRWLSGERRKERRLGEQGTLSFLIGKEQQDIERILAEMARQKSASYKEMGVSNLFEQQSYRDFFECMSRLHTRDCFVHVCTLMLDQRILTTHWGLVYKNRFYFIMPTYDNSAYARYSPGNILLRHMFEWCIENDVQVFDFLAGDEAYKDLWCDQTLKLYSHFDSHTWKGFLFIWPVRLQRRIKRGIKGSPVLFRLAGYMRKLLSRF
jgi:CelD/BcsL family acetyltransferase involved in cellulose biosynthesis